MEKQIINLLGKFLLEISLSESQAAIALHTDDGGHWRYSFPIDSWEKEIFTNCLKLHCYEHFALDTPLSIECDGKTLWQRESPLQQALGAIQEWEWRGLRFILMGPNGTKIAI